LGTNSEHDKEVFSKEVTKNVAIESTDLPRIYVNPGSDYLLGTVNTGGSTFSSIYYAKIEDVINRPAEGVKWNKICSIDEKISAYLLKGTELYCISNNVNPNGRFEKINIFTPTERKILYDAKDVVLSDILGTRNFIYLTYQKYGYSKLFEFDYTTDAYKNIELPFPGTIEFTPNFVVTSPYSHSDNLVFGMASWNREWEVYTVLADKKPERLNIMPDDDIYNLKDIHVEVVEVTSHDGVKVPLSIIYRKDIQRNGLSPTLLYGYGAYGVCYTPGFAYSRLLWLNKGGIIAFAHIRGGGIKGEEWHIDGMKKNKPNTWKDFIACAEYLINEKYTSNEKLAAYGGSAGGITVGRAITERPDLFKACILDVGSLNISRYEVTDSTGGDVEFGTATDSLEFGYLNNMDSYLHINDNSKYPAVFATAGLNDKNVSPWEPAKFCARLQQIPNSQNVVLLWPYDGDHFGAWNIDLELSNFFSFLLWQLGHQDFKLTNK
jgi:prolyl oligopeptidase